MIQYLPQINDTIKGLGVLVGEQNKLVRLLLRNWPFLGLAGLALFGQLRRRMKAKDLTLFTGLVDTGMILTPLVALLSLSKLAEDAEDAQAKALMHGRVAAALSEQPGAQTALPIQTSR